MVYRVLSCSFQGLDPRLVQVEVSSALDLPGLVFVGLPGPIVQESRERIRSAVLNSGFEWPARRMTVSLLPTSVPKIGAPLELAIALGLVLCDREKSDGNDPSQNRLFAFGELSLSGELRSVPWLSGFHGHRILDYASQQGATKILCATEDALALEKAKLERSKDEMGHRQIEILFDFLLLLNFFLPLH